MTVQKKSIAFVYKECNKGLDWLRILRHATDEMDVALKYLHCIH